MSKQSALARLARVYDPAGRDEDAAHRHADRRGGQGRRCSREGGCGPTLEAAEVQLRELTARMKRLSGRSSASFRARR
jgi:hypothetical protein